jgi:hypothetical protein
VPSRDLLGAVEPGCFGIHQLRKRDLFTGA